MKLECPRCGHTWKQATPRWDRGHLLMKRGDRTVFAIDDLCYAFDASIQDVVDPLLRTIGYSHLTYPCPQCGDGNARVVRGLLAPPNYGSEEFACTELDENDFIKVGPKWELRPEAVEELTRS